MSDLNDYGLYIGCSIFMRWECDNVASPLNLVVVSKLELVDRDPFRIKATVYRQSGRGDKENECILRVTRAKLGMPPSLTFFESGVDVVWAMVPKSAKVVPQTCTLKPDCSPKIVVSPLKNIEQYSFRRPIHALSSKVFRLLSTFL